MYVRDRLRAILQLWHETKQRQRHAAAAAAAAAAAHVSCGAASATATRAPARQQATHTAAVTTTTTTTTMTTTTPAAVVDPHHFILLQHGVMGTTSDLDNLVKALLVDHAVAVEEVHAATRQATTAAAAARCDYCSNHNSSSSGVSHNNNNDDNDNNNSSDSCRSTPAPSLRHAYSSDDVCTTRDARRALVWRRYVLREEHVTCQGGKVYRSGHRVCFTPGANQHVHSLAGTRVCAVRLLREFLPVFDAWLSSVHEQQQQQQQQQRDEHARVTRPCTPVCFSCVGHSFGGVLLREFLYLLLVCGETTATTTATMSRGDLVGGDAALHTRVLSTRARMRQLRVTCENVVTVATPHCGTTECLLPPFRWGAWLLNKASLSVTVRELMHTDDERMLLTHLLDVPHLCALRLFRHRVLFANTYRDFLVGFATSSLLFEPVQHDTTRLCGVQPHEVPCAAAFADAQHEVSTAIFVPPPPPPPQPSPPVTLRQGRDGDDDARSSSSSSHDCDTRRRRQGAHTTCCALTHTLDDVPHCLRTLQRAAAAAATAAVADSYKSDGCSDGDNDDVMVTATSERHQHNSSNNNSSSSSRCATRSVRRNDHGTYGGCGVHDGSNSSSTSSSSSSDDATPPVIIIGSPRERSCLQLPLHALAPQSTTTTTTKTTTRARRDAPSRHDKDESTSRASRAHVTSSSSSSSSSSLIVVADNGDSRKDGWLAVSDVYGGARQLVHAPLYTTWRVLRLVVVCLTQWPYQRLRQQQQQQACRCHRHRCRHRGHHGRGALTSSCDDAGDCVQYNNGYSADSEDDETTAAATSSSCASCSCDACHAALPARVQLPVTVLSVLPHGSASALPMPHTAATAATTAATATPRLIARTLRRYLDWRVRAVRVRTAMPIAHYSCLGNLECCGVTPAIVTAVADEVACVLR